MISTLQDIDGIPVEHEEAPPTTEELSRIMKDAGAAARTMSAVGSATRLHLGNPPRSVHLALRTCNLRGIIDYEPGNLTVSARAGTSLRELQETLGNENQFLPLDPSAADRTTLGGIVACNASGPIRFRYGTVRDMLIGIKVVHADGSTSRAGGNLVKNVSGYDMCKLYAGSLGTLAVIAELIFRVQPKPEAMATVQLAFPTLPAALEAVQTLLRADLAPEALEALDGNAFEAVSGSARAAAWNLLIRCGDSDMGVRWQVDRIREIAAGAEWPVMEVLDTGEAQEFWRKAGEADACAPGDEVVRLKCSALAHALHDAAQGISAAGRRLGAHTMLFCHAGNGVLYGCCRWPRGGCPAEDLRREILSLRRSCISGGGHLVVEKAPPEVKQGLDVWGYQAPALAIMRRIKEQFDPGGLLNPGRYVGGI